MALFSGNAHPDLAQDIARVLHVPLAKAQVGRFSDGEINVEILENIRGRETFIIQPTCPPTAENLMELLVMVDACQRASASRITAAVFRFCAPGPPAARRACAHHGETGRQADRHRRG